MVFLITAVIVCSVEYWDSILRAFTKILTDKQASTTIPIIYYQVAAHSTIYTDEHRSYSSFNSLNFIHDSVCRCIT